MKQEYYLQGKTGMTEELPNGSEDRLDQDFLEKPFIFPTVGGVQPLLFYAGKVVSGLPEQFDTVAVIFGDAGEKLEYAE